MKLVLDNDELSFDFFDNTRLLGIIASMKNYHFCWQVNQQLGLSFIYNNDIEIHLKRKRRDYFFNLYSWREPETQLVHYIYHNQNDGEYLLPEFKHIDFLWLMKGDFVEPEKSNRLIKSIRQINGVQLVTELTNEQIKTKGNLVF